ncbi:hypothetical protein [Paracoccus sp. M683]|nr:hypothetical protein [Paracoccus sp. M683]
MSNTTTYNAGRAWAQLGKQMPNLRNVPYQVRQDFKSGYNFGKK